MSYSSRGINGQKCLDCCERQRELTELSIRGFLSELLNRVLDIRLKGSEDQILALIPPTRVRFRPLTLPQPARIIQVTRGAPLVLGAVVLLAAFALGSLLAQLAAIETLQGILDGLEYFLPDDCENCVKKGLWKQTNQQLLVNCEGNSTLRRRQGKLL